MCVFSGDLGFIISIFNLLLDVIDFTDGNLSAHEYQNLFYSERRLLH